MNTIHRRRGFTLAELSIVLVIIGIVTGVGLQYGTSSIESARVKQTKEKLQVIREALSLYESQNSKLPCPAPLNAVPGDLAFGVATNCAVAVVAGVTSVAGDTVRIGAVPIKDLNLSEQYARDAWDNKFTYVMTKTLGIFGSGAGQYGNDATVGAISMRDGSGNSISSPADQVAYAVISHGKDGLGAFPIKATTANACNSTATKDQENCDSDVVFNDTRYFDETDAAVYANYFDDFVTWAVKKQGGISGEVDPQVGTVSANYLCYGDSASLVQCTGPGATYDMPTIKNAGVATDPTNGELTATRVIPGANSNVFVGLNAGVAEPGVGNVAVGNEALLASTDGAQNVAIGANALRVNLTGIRNTVVGADAMSQAANGAENVAIGYQAGYRIASAGNVAIGYGAVTNPVTGGTVAVGAGALAANEAADNTAIGSFAMGAGGTGSSNVAVGANALFNNTVDGNTAIGTQAMNNNQNGTGNVAVGYYALNTATTASRNTAIGYQSLNGVLVAVTGNDNTAVGYHALTANTGLGNTAVGSNALAAAAQSAMTNNTVIGFDAGAALNHAGATDNTIVGAGAMSQNARGNSNVAIGKDALYNHTSGNSNVAVGHSALFTNGSATANVGVGYASLKLSSADNNTALGYNTLTANTAGTRNTAVGSIALDAIADAGDDDNTAVGYNALGVNAGAGNTAVGSNALSANTGGNNTAVGFNAALNAAGSQNVAIGRLALSGAGHNANNNIAIGGNAMNGANITGGGNVAIGFSALNGVSLTGLNNVAVGNSATVGAAVSSAVAVGVSANAGATGAVALGSSANASVSNAIAIGAGAAASGNNTIVLGAGMSSSTADEVILGVTGAKVSNTGLFIPASDRRIKTDIRDTHYGLGDIMKLRPVDYTHIKSGKAQVGFIAQDVKKVIPELVDGKEGDIAKGGILTLSYDQLVAPVVKAIQQLKTMVDSLIADVKELFGAVKALQAENQKLKEGQARQAKEIEELKAAVRELKAKNQ